MNDYSVLWVPGSDHAGIATQIIVEKHIKAQTGKTRHDIGREQFLKEIFKWREEKGDSILAQLRRLGASLDWSRQRFTMDEVLYVEKLSIFYKSAKILLNFMCQITTAVSKCVGGHNLSLIFFFGF